MIWIFIIVMISAIDQISKYLIIKNVKYNQLIPVIDKFFYITYHENKGAAWGIMQEKRSIFIVLTLVLSVIMGYVLFKTENRLLKLSLSLILGGAIGNLIDRIFKGSVADFLDFHFGAYNFPTFNVADMFIVIGTILLSIFILFIYKEPNLEGVESGRK
jgi:signal peptidase II